jgi:ribosome-interacting GTPase 1
MALTAACSTQHLSWLILGVIHYNESKIQLLDLPGIIEGAAEGKGRGRQVG